MLFPTDKKNNSQQPIQKNYDIGTVPFQVYLKIRPILFEERQISVFETVTVLDRESLILTNKNKNEVF